MGARGERDVFEINFIAEINVTLPYKKTIDSYFDSYPTSPLVKLLLPDIFTKVAFKRSTRIVFTH